MSDPLPGGWRTRVTRTGDVVHRPAREWSRPVMALLRHLGEREFAGAPRPIGTGFDEDEQYEVLQFVPGKSPQPHAWNDEGIYKLGAMLAEFHAAAESFVPPENARWQPWYGRNLGDPTSGFGHGDLGPWNIMAVDGLPTGFIDWDTAGPMDQYWELAQAAWLNVQLHDDDIAGRVGLGAAADRGRQLATFLDGYGLGRGRRAGLIDCMVEVAVHDAAAQAIDHAVTPETTSGIAEDGYPFAWGMAWRVRGASWMLRHRRLLEAAIGA